MEELASLPVTKFSRFWFVLPRSNKFRVRMKSKVLRKSVAFLFWDIFPIMVSSSFYKWELKKLPSYLFEATEAMKM